VEQAATDTVFCAQLLAAIEKYAKEAKWETEDYDLFELKVINGWSYREIAEARGGHSTTWFHRYNNRIQPLLDKVKAQFEED
jgi:hypothetical protein